MNMSEIQNKIDISMKLYRCVMFSLLLNKDTYMQTEGMIIESVIYCRKFSAFICYFLVLEKQRYIYTFFFFGKQSLHCFSWSPCDIHFGR